MLTLYYAPRSRATRILALTHELDLRDKVRYEFVSIPRIDGSGTPDAHNPHPDRKVPALLDGDTLITESLAIALYLTDMFPEAGLGPVVGDPQRGPYLAWLAYYAGVMEPVYNAMVAGVGDHPVFRASFRGVPEVEARLIAAFADGRSYLLGDRLSAADLLVQSPYMWFPDGAPKDAKVQAWIDRVAARPSYAWATRFEAEQEAAQTAPA
ncbi:MAG: glutathione S-transferase family protein [Paracoccaceae bacterium]|nr:glutathione S-transferase family protein [Maritimibacter sp.]